jgi:hypothetical protein
MQYEKDIFDKTGIFVFKNALSEDLCKKTILQFEQNKKSQFKGKTSGGYEPRIKETTDYYIHGGTEQKIFSILKIATEIVLDKYWFLRNEDIAYSGLQLQKNIKNKGFFKWHIDYNKAATSSYRILAPIFYLNDVEEGGFTEFAYQDLKVKPETGKLIIFPCTWQYLHRGIIPRSNDKYIITTFGTSPRPM